MSDDHKQQLESQLWNIEVWAGAEKLGELKQGKLTIKLPQAGFNPVYLKAVDDSGEVVRSRPNTLIVE